MDNNRFVSKCKAIRELEQSLTRLTTRTEKWGNTGDFNRVMRNSLGGLYSKLETFESFRSGLESKYGFLTKPVIDLLDPRLYSKLIDPSEWEKHRERFLRATTFAISRFARLGACCPTLHIM